MRTNRLPAILCGLLATAVGACADETDNTGEAAQAAVVYRIDQAVIYCDPLGMPRPALYRGPSNPSGHDLVIVEDDHEIQEVSEVPIASSVTISYDTSTGAVLGVACLSSPSFLEMPHF